MAKKEKQKSEKKNIPTITMDGKEYHHPINLKVDLSFEELLKLSVSENKKEEK